MIKFDKPTNLNGTELLAELNAAGVAITESPFDDAVGGLWLNIKQADKAKAASVVAAHNGTIVAKELSIEAKLAQVGLNFEDLKAALLA